MYLSVCTRPDLAYAISTLASFNSNPRLCHWKAAKELLSYVHSTRAIGITYGKHIDNDINKLSIYADADYASVHTKRRSRGGYIIFMNGGPIEWHSSLQPKISLCTSESELYAMVSACKQGKYLKHFLETLGYPQSSIDCYEDNKGALDWLTNGRSSSRMRQLEAETYWLKQEVNDDRIFTIHHIATAFQRADFLTKCMDPGPFYTQLDLNHIEE